MRRARAQRIDDLAAGAGAAGTTGAAGRGAGTSLAASAWRRLRRNPVFLIGAVITLGFVTVALLAPWL
ncbi:MAG TPA: ABC transporter permease, partial [Pseudonocardiaceae bacterium]|nr:ABC transporter permease [Pseudonocardiaceae bacterium]